MMYVWGCAARHCSQQYYNQSQFSGNFVWFLNLRYRCLAVTLVRSLSNCWLLNLHTAFTDPHQKRRKGHSELQISCVLMWTGTLVAWAYRRANLFLANLFLNEQFDIDCIESLSYFVIHKNVPFLLLSKHNAKVPPLDRPQLTTIKLILLGIMSLGRTFINMEKIEMLAYD